MAGVAESSSTLKEVGEKPVIVRVKRKVGQSPLDAFWLEINERPSKRPFLDFSKLSISKSVKKEDVKPKKVLVRHLETVTDAETTVDIIHSFFKSDRNDQSCSRVKFEDRKIAFKKDNRKEQRLTKAVQQQQAAAQNARFEQIWRSRKGNKEGIQDKELHEKCNFYDVLRVDAEERLESAPEVTSLEDQKLLASFLPLLKECIPTAAEEIETDIHSGNIHTEEYVYDFYAVNEDMDISEDTSKHQFPLVIVEEEEEFCDGSDSSDYDSDDSNAEAHPRNDYPEEMSEEEEEEEEDEEEEEEDEEEKSEASDESKDEESSERHVRMVLDEDDEFFGDGYAEDVNVYGDSDDELEYR